MSTKRILAAVAASMLATTPVLAGQLVVTPSSSTAKSGASSVSLDISTEGNVSGFNFFVRTGELKAGSVDLSMCTSELPKGFVGHCVQRADGVGVIAYAEGKATLPAGVVSVGRLGLPAEFRAKRAGIQIEELTLADVEGNVIASESVVAE